MTQVILDTDIGTDIDDTWALAMLLASPELNLRLVVTASGETTYRARIAAGILAAGGRDDIPVAIGIPTTIAPAAYSASIDGFRPQERCAAEVDLDGYAGGVAKDGVRALVDSIMGSPEPVTVIATGPATNVAAALRAEPAIASRARVVAMLGSVHTGYLGSPGPVAEYNVAVDVGACREVFSASWEVSITPLDTCGSIVLRGAPYQRLRDAGGALIKAVFRNYEEWAAAEQTRVQNAIADGEPRLQPGNEMLDDLEHGRLIEHSTTVLYDTVAVYMAYDESMLNVERLPIALDDNGTMQVAQGAPEIRVATSWKDRDAFLTDLLARLTGTA